MTDDGLHRLVWGKGPTVIALHPLGLDASAFEGFGAVLGQGGLRTVAVDMPGFGRTPYPHEPLTIPRLARPVIGLARELAERGDRPAVIGVSLGGRVALECALEAPELFRSVIAVAPWLPWLRFREPLRFARLLDPAMAERVRLELLWPLLRPLAWTLERAPYLREDELAQAGARLVYYFSCPATRAAFVSAAREMALESAFGPGGFWTRLPGLEVPAAFVWGERDRLVTWRFAERVSRSLPQASQVVLPCVAHALNGSHHRCLARTLAALLRGHPGDAVPVDCTAEPRAGSGETGSSQRAPAS